MQPAFECQGTHDANNLFKDCRGINIMSTTIQKKTYTIVLTPDLEEGGFVGTCDELHAVSEGDTFGEVMENMRDAMELAVEANGNTTDFNMLVIEK